MTNLYGIVQFEMHLINNEFYDKLSYIISMQLSSNMSSGAKFFNIIMPCIKLKFQNISSSYDKILNFNTH